VALFNEILVGRFDNFFRKFFGMKGGALAPQLSSEIMPGLDIPLFVDILAPMGWDMYGVTSTQAAVAAQTSDIRLRNPANSGVIAVLTSALTANNNGAPQVNFYQNGPATGDLATVSAMGRGLDSRSGRPPALILSRTNNGVGLSGSWASSLLATNVTFDPINDWWNFLPILPGDAVQVGGSSVNTNLQINWRWMERPLEDSEKRI
jgi:hypothetical protein